MIVILCCDRGCDGMLVRFAYYVLYHTQRTSMLVLYLCCAESTEILSGGGEYKLLNL